MGLGDIVHAVKETREFRKEAEIALSQALPSCLELETEYKSWRKTYRLNTIACCTFVANQLCKLEGKAFDNEKRQRVYFGAAAACISDDLIDKSHNFNSREVYFLDSHTYSMEKTSSLQKLFYVFHSKLERLLPQNFESRFKELISRYNEAQKHGRKLNKEIDDLELITIKDNTGGYPAALFYKIIFPDSGDFPEDFSPDYSPRKGRLPKTKMHAIFNFGAMFSRLDDLSDLKPDKENKVKSLATQGLVTWNSLEQDVKYVKDGLKIFFPEKKVESVMEIYSPSAMKTLHLIERLL